MSPLLVTLTFPLASRLMLPGKQLSTVHQITREWLGTARDGVDIKGIPKELDT